MIEIIETYLICFWIERIENEVRKGLFSPNNYFFNIRIIFININTFNSFHIK